jgi:hypothetical protein
VLWEHVYAIHRIQDLAPGQIGMHWGIRGTGSEQQWIYHQMVDWRVERCTCCTKSVSPPDKSVVHIYLEAFLAIRLAVRASLCQVGTAARQVSFPTATRPLHPSRRGLRVVRNIRWFADQLVSLDCVLQRPPPPAASGYASAPTEVA